jgi:PAS domain S-box-containing protein
MSQNSTILIVDDNPLNLEVLSTILNRAGYEVRVEIDSTSAIEQVQREKPDLILLDIMMPEIDGFEICQQLKIDSDTQHIPIIFISALDDATAKVKSFNLGAVDYVTKPFQQKEVLARIGLQLQIKQLQTDLEEKNSQLQKLTEDLEKQVARRTTSLTRSLDDLEKTQQQLQEANTKLQNHARNLEVKVFFRTLSLKKEIEERQKAERAYRESEERFRLMANKAPVLLWTTNKENEFTFLNDRWFEFTGYNPQQPIKNAWLENIHPDDRTSVVQTFSSAFKERVNFTIEYRLKKTDGQYRWMVNTGVPRFLANGDLAGYIGSCIDISDRREAEDALIESESKFRRLVENANDMIYCTSVEGIFTYFSPKIKDILGYDPLEVVGKPFSFLCHPEDLSVAQTFHENILQIGDNTPGIEIRVPCKNGTYCWILISSTPIEDLDGNLIGYHGIARDISDRKRTETALRHSEEKFRQIFEDAPLAMGILDLETSQILSANRAACQLFKYTQNELAKLSSEDLVHPEDDPLDKQTLKKLICGEITKIEREKRYLTKDGDVIWGSLTGTLIRDRDENALYLLVMLKDITEQKLVEQNLNRSQQILQDCFENAPIGLQWISQDGLILWANQSQLEMLGYSKDEYIGHHVAEFHSDRDLIDNILKQLASQGNLHNCEAVLKCKDGSNRYVQINSNVLRENNRFLYTRCFVNDITDLKEAERKIQLSEERLQLALEISEHGLWDWNVTTQEVYLSPQWLEMLGYKKDELAESFESWVSLIHPEDEPWVMDTLNAHLQDSLVPYYFDYRVLTKSGEWKWISNQGKVVDRDENNLPLRMTGTHKDISDRKQTEERLKASLKEKEVLLKEVHHRVKNNLYIISTLLKLQTKNFQDQKIIDIFQDSQNRISSMALIHEKLYRSQDLSSIDFADYIKNLSRDILHSYGINPHIIELEISCADLFLSIDLAIPCGLIINELISNSLKYAFTENRQGKISIGLDRDRENNYILSVADDGIGFPKNLNFRKTTSLGLRLVCNLTEQLDGEVEIYTNNGTRFEIIFPDRSNGLSTIK